jgi:hypothetical protein
LGQSNTPADAAKTASHEAGHLLGLAHVEDVLNREIMEQNFLPPGATFTDIDLPLVKIFDGFQNSDCSIRRSLDLFFPSDCPGPLRRNFGWSFFDISGGIYNVILGVVFPGADAFPSYIEFVAIDPDEILDIVFDLGVEQFYLLGSSSPGGEIDIFAANRRIESIVDAAYEDFLLDISDLEVDASRDVELFRITEGQIEAFGRTRITLVHESELPPEAYAGVDQVLECIGIGEAMVTLDGRGSSDPEGDPLTYTWEGPFGILDGETVEVVLPIGVHTITLTVDDGNGRIDSDTVEVTVEDTTPPELSLTVSPDMLWPPNHKMVPITVTVTANDGCDPSPVFALKSITMNEGEVTNTYDPNYDDTVGDDDTMNDIVVDPDDGSISLRAERSGTGEGRVYTITYSATDASGNATTASATVTVPHNQ